MAPDVRISAKPHSSDGRELRPTAMRQYAHGPHCGKRPRLTAIYLCRTSKRSRLDQTRTLTTAKTEVRTVTQEKIFSAPPGKIRVEFDGTRESSLLIADGVSE
jgi:hypothetical protein